MAYICFWVYSMGLCCIAWPLVWAVVYSVASGLEYGLWPVAWPMAYPRDPIKIVSEETRVWDLHIWDLLNDRSH